MPYQDSEHELLILEAMRKAMPDEAHIDRDTLRAICGWAAGMLDEEIGYLLWMLRASNLEGSAWRVHLNRKLQFVVQLRDKLRLPVQTDPNYRPPRITEVSGGLPGLGKRR